MRTLIVSDLHLGARDGTDVLRGPAAGALHEMLTGFDRLVLLGDTLELRQGPTGAALRMAQPVARALGEAFEGSEVILVPGNHDHAVMSGWLQARALREEPVPLALEERFGASEGSPVAAALAAWLGAERVAMAYPGVWLRQDVYATHGHYLDCHSTLPTMERLAAGVMARLLGPLSERSLAPDDYERLLAPIYAWIDSVAGRASAESPAPHGTSARTWRMLAGDARRPVRARALAGLLRVGVGLLNRMGIGPVSPDLSGAHLRRCGHEAMIEVVERLEIAAGHVVFGHTHRAGPLVDEDHDAWRTPAGVCLHNCGNWVFEPGLLARRPESPFWPGSCIELPEAGAPVLHRLLGAHSSWAPGPSSR